MPCRAPQGVLMASGVPPLDTSVTDRRWQCTTCQYRHQPGSECPRRGVWLVSGAPVRHLRVVRTAA
jgi:hypothetical protein